MGVALSGGREDDLLQKNFFYPTRTYAFRGAGAWRPPGNATPTFRVPNESWNPGLSADILFVSVVVMVLSENWKTLEENFRKKIISAISQNDENYKKYFLQRFSIFWKNHYYYRNKRYISRKPWISALIWHPKSGRGPIRRAPRPLAAKSIFCWILWPRGGFFTFWLPWPL